MICSLPVPVHIKYDQVEVAAYCLSDWKSFPPAVVPSSANRTWFMVPWNGKLISV